jgi:hypothetical protein
MAENKTDTKADEEVLDNMQRSRQNTFAGNARVNLLAEETPDQPAAEETTTLPEGATMIYPANDALIKARPAEPATSVAPVGLSERSWSPEVTARDTRLLAEELDTMAGEAGSAARDAEIDPNDAAALDAAVREGGFLEVRMDMARMNAVNRLNDRLANGIGEIQAGIPVARAAVEQAAEQAKARLEAVGEERAARQAQRETRRETRETRREAHRDTTPPTTPPPTTTASTPPAPPARTRTNE